MLTLDNLSVAAGEFRLRDISLSVAGGAYAVLMGSTGCGKTTLLETICGIKKATKGRVMLNGRDITRAPIAHRGIGYVPQDAAVFPRMTVRENLAFPLLVRGEGQRATNTVVERLAEQLSIAHLLDRRASGLSGGESQRVALGRALASRPKLLLLDEPLAALDEETHASILGLLRRVQADTGVTTLHVTHSQTEAEGLADQVLTIRNGRIEPRLPMRSGPSKAAGPQNATAVPG